jgi:hypothetical protein
MRYRLTLALILLVRLCASAQSTAAEHSLGPENPWMAAGGAAAEHNDAYSSNVSPRPGPGGSAVRVSVTRLGALCPTIVLDNYGYLFAYCVNTEDRSSTLRMLDPNTLAVLATLDMPRGGRLGGFYMYMDRLQRIVLGAGDNRLLRISHMRDATGQWHLRVVNSWDLSQEVAVHCGSGGCDYLESVNPDWSGRIWFSTEGGVVGTVDPKTGLVRSMTLPAGEKVANSISSSPAGVAVASDHALYLFGSRADGEPVVVWREAYDRGSAVKPGQLSHGTGATPAFFGRDGYSYVAITDNADEQEHLLVYRVAGKQAGQIVCRVPLFAPGASGNENGPIGIGNSVIVSNTFGYDYQNFTGRDLHSMPGGLTRIDLGEDGSGCDTVWANPLSSAAVPKMSIRDGIVYTVARTLKDSTPQYRFAAIDFRNGATLNETWIGDSYSLDTFQLAGAMGFGSVLYQPGLSGIIQVRPETGARKR